MIKISVEFIKTELLTERYLKYIEHYPNLKEKIEDFRTKPKCPACLKGVAVPVLEHKYAKHKLSQIYETTTFNIQLDTTTDMPKSIVWEQTTEVHKVSPDDYEEWVSELYKVKAHPSPQVKNFNTFFNPIENKVVVTLLLLKPIRK